MKRTLELYDCDKCGNEGQRYSVVFPEGALVMDRCELHAKKLEALRSEVGEWVHTQSLGRNSFKKSTLVELRSAVEAARKGPDQQPEDRRLKEA